MILLKRITFLFILFYTISGCKSQDEFKMNGISLVAPINAIDSSHITKFKKLNPNYTAVIPYGFMKDLHSTEVMYNTERQWWGERMDGARKTIELLHDQNIAVMLKPQIWIWHGEYTGNIDIDNEEKWQQLESSYEAFILDYAQLAQDSNAQMLCIGTELESFVETRPEYWTQLITKIKNIYKGKLTYASNWDSYKRVPFWDQIDFIGIDAYFPMSEEKTPQLADIQESWKQWKGEMITLSRKHNKKILFTEYGYISADYAGKEPWKSAGEQQEENQEAQAILLDGLYQSVWNEEWFAGGFLWKYHADTYDDDFIKGFERLYTPQHKLAQETVTKAYSNNE